MAVTIQILEGDPAQQNQTFSLDKTTVLIGRGSEQDVRLANDSVSRRHCVIEKREGQWSVIDEDTPNGVILNGQRVREKKAIHHGDILEIGEVMLRVGLDRPLKDERKRSAKASLPVIVRTITALVVSFVLALAGLGMFLFYDYFTATRHMTATLPVKLVPEKPITVFADNDKREITYAPLDLFPMWFASPRLVLDNPVPEWNTGRGQIWSTQGLGQTPRLFEGLDLDLRGGEQVVSSSYFFLRHTYNARDARDPMGMLIFELEGWAGLGTDYDDVDAMPALRKEDLPQYVRSAKLFPQNIKSLSHAEFQGAEKAQFSWSDWLNPPAPGSPVAPPSHETLLALPKRTGRRVLYQGVYYSFFHEGCRYTAVVRGTANLLDRFQGKLDAVGEAFFNSIKIQKVEPDTPLEPATLARNIKEKTTMLVAYSRKPNVLNVVSFEDLLTVRELLLDLQKSPQPIEGETELRRLYFEIRNRTQKSLEISAGKAYDGRKYQRSKEGERELMRIRNFLGNHPPLTLKRGQTGYPEWAWFFEDVISVAPYATLRDLRTRQNL